MPFPPNDRPMAIIAFAILVFTSLLLPRQFQPKKTVILGALEDQPGIYQGDSHFRDVRVMFYEEGNEWKSFPSNSPGQQPKDPPPFPPEMTWSIGFQGKILGKVTGRADHTGRFSFLALVGAEKIVSAGAVPTVGKESPIYEDADSPVYRPLVANSQPYFNDTEAWRPANISPNLLASLRQHFRQKYPHVENCRNADENIERRWLYQDKNITLADAYRSRNGEIIAGLALGPVRCDYEDQAAYQEPWFVVQRDGTIRFVGYWLKLLDSGDYGNDGGSEMLFLSPPVSCGGYSLYYDDFRKHVSFSYICH